MPLPFSQMNLLLTDTCHNEKLHNFQCEFLDQELFYQVANQIYQFRPLLLYFGGVTGKNLKSAARVQAVVTVMRF